MARTVEIDADIFVDMLYERAYDFGDKYYPKSFWDEVIPFLDDTEVWESLRVDERSPSYIIDNIAINGEIYEVDEYIKDNDLDMNADSEEFEEYCEDNGYDIFDDYIIISWGI